MIEVDVLFDSGPWDEGHLSDLAQAAVTAAIAHSVPQHAGFAVSIMACDSARIAVLNADFRDKPKPTNVLSWPSEERGAAVPGGPPIAPNDPELGDIAIAYEVCAREAAEQNKDFDAHVTHLLVHATLHLLGYDHETDGDAALMEGLEVRILREMGLSDPYMDAVR